MAGWSLQFAVCDEAAANSLYFSIYSGCTYGYKNIGDEVVQNITSWTVGQLVQNCSLPCLPSATLEFVAFTKVPSASLLVGASGMLLYSKRQRALSKAATSNRLSSRQFSSGSQRSIRSKKPLMQLVHRRIVIISNAIAMAMAGLCDFVPKSRGGLVPRYNPSLSLLGHPELCIFGVPSAQQRVYDYREHYWFAAFFVTFHTAIMCVSILFVAHYVYWRSKSVQRILNENKEVRNSMSGLVILQPWIASLLCLSIIGYLSLPIFDFTESKQGDNCLPYLIQNIYAVPFIGACVYLPFNIRLNFTLLFHLKRKKVGETSVATQSTLRRFLKDLVFLVATLLGVFPLVRSSTATQLSWGTPFFFARLVFFSAWFAHATIAKKERIRVPKRSEVSTRSIQNKISNQFSNRQVVRNSTNGESGSVKRLSLSVAGNRNNQQQPNRGPRNEECSSVGVLSFAYENCRVDESSM